MSSITLPRLLILLFLVASAVSEEEEVPPKWGNYSSNFIPVHYDVQMIIVPNKYGVDENGGNQSSPIAKFSLMGKVRIEGGMDSSSKQSESDMEESFPGLILHVQNLSVDAISVSVQNDTSSIPILEVEKSPQGNYLRVVFFRKISSGDKLEISVDFSAPIPPFTPWDDTAGPLLRSVEYRDGNGTEGLNRTYFVPMSPDSFLFPFVGDPNDLSTYEITVLVEEGYTAISNMPMMTSDPDLKYPGWVRQRFERSPPMTLRSVALFISVFDHVEEVAEDGTVVRVHAPKPILEEKGRGIKAAKAVINVVDFYANYFNSSSQVRKFDLVWVPTGGAVVRPGLLVTNKLHFYSTTDARFRVWWMMTDDEELATVELFGAVAALHLSQQPPVWDTYVAKSIWAEGELNFTWHYLYLDDVARAAVRPEREVELEVTCVEDFVLELDFSHEFGSNYRKICQREDFNMKWDISEELMPALVMRGLLAEDTIREGYRSFSKKVRRSTGEKMVDLKASHNLFMEELQRAGREQLPPNVTLKEALDSWKKQVKMAWPGVEAQRVMIVKVEVVNSTHLSVTQERIKGQLAVEDQEGPWYLPVTVVTEEGVQASFWLRDQGVPTVIPLNHTHAKWVLVNPNRTAIHRTLYSPELLEKLTLQLESDHSVFPPLVRLRLIDDHFSFLHLRTLAHVKAQNLTLFEDMSIPNVLLLTGYLHKERDLLVWVRLLENFDKHLAYQPEGRARPTLSRPETLAIPPVPGIGEINKYFSRKLHPTLESIYVEELHNHSKIQLTLEAHFLYRACRMGSVLCLEKGLDLFQQWREEPDLFPLCEYFSALHKLLEVVVMGGGREAVEWVLQLHRKNIEGEIGYCGYLRESTVLVALLAQSREPALLKEMVSMTLFNETFNKGRNLSQWLFQDWGVFSTRRGGAAADFYRDYLYENCELFGELRNSKGEKLNETDLWVFPQTNDRNQFAQLEAFVGSKPDCLRNATEAEIEKEVEERRVKMEKFEEWADSVGRKMQEWFTNANKDYGSRHLKVPGIEISGVSGDDCWHKMK